MKIVVPDLISNSYFPVIAAADLGFFRQEGLDLELELLFPVDAASFKALRSGTVDFVGGSAHSALAAFPRFARRETPGRSGAGDVLVSGHALGYRSAARQC